MIFDPSAGNAVNLSDIGGKALNLNRLLSMGFNVPDWIAVTKNSYWAFFESNDLVERVGNEVDDIDFEDLNIIRAAAERIQSIIMQGSIPENVKGYILEAYNSKFPNDGYVSVRSSAVGEDTAGASYAGQLDSFLFISGQKEMLEAVKKCWASAFSERVLLYRWNHNVPPFEKRMGVIIQEMIKADISGVTFTADPVSGDLNIISISATYGLGEGIVAGIVPTDTYSYNMSTGSIDSEITQKTEKISFNSKQGSGTSTESIENDLQNESVLSERQIKEYSSIWKSIEFVGKYPQDIEWSIFDGELYILQSRPITTLSNLPGEVRIWDNSNIVESFSGVTTPLTFSFAREAYTKVYENFCEIMGVSRKEISENHDLFGNMIGLIKGRVYYNLVSWYRLISLFPGYQYNKEFMEQMMGVKEIEKYQPTHPEPGRFKRIFVYFPRSLRVTVKMLFNLITIKRKIRQFDENFMSVYHTYLAKDFNSMNPDELITAYLYMKRKLLYNWKPPLINDFFAMIFYGTLRKVVEKWVPNGSGALQNDLLCGEGGIESTEPTLAIIKMALMISTDSSFCEWVLSTPDKDLYKLLEESSDDNKSELYALVKDYLDKYGYRCMEELKLESLSLRDDPSVLFSLIKNYVQIESLNLEEMEERKQEIRMEAEREVYKAIKWKTTFLILPKKFVFNSILKLTRLLVKNRENMRFNRTKIFGLVRDLMNALGRKFNNEGFLGDPRDIYYLEIDDVIGFVQGTTTTPNLKELVQMRKKLYEEFLSEEPAPHFLTQGPVFIGNDFKGSDTAQSMEVEEGSLMGIGCCPGIIKAPVQIVSSYLEGVDLKGKILVADRTDPGWVPLFPMSKGLLIQRGSLLSHSAIVARELGIPTIVGIDNLLNTLENGQTVTMDGSTGIVTLEK